MWGKIRMSPQIKGETNACSKDVRGISALAGRSSNINVRSYNNAVRLFSWMLPQFFRL
jgi:hypothetical protein